MKINENLNEDNLVADIRKTIHGYNFRVLRYSYLKGKRKKQVVEERERDGSVLMIVKEKVYRNTSEKVPIRTDLKRTMLFLRRRVIIE